MSAMRTGLSVLAISGMLNAAALAQSADGQTSGAKQPADASSSQAGQRSSAQSGAQAQSSQQQQRGAQQQQQGQAGDQAPEGWVLVEERIVVLTANEPQNHFLRAQQYLTQGNAKGAAAEARVGAAYLEMQASRAKGAADQRLTDAAEALRQQGSQIAQAKGDAQQLQKYEQQLKQSFAQANAALAAHFKSLAQRSLQNQRNVMAGYDLNAAAESLAAAFAWSGNQPQQEATTAIRDAQQVAVQLMTPNGSGQQQEAQQGGTAEDRAQTAAAQINQTGGQAPANASQAIDKLGSAIQQSSGSFQNAGKQAEQGQSGKQGQSGSTGQSGNSGQSGSSGQ